MTHSFANTVQSFATAEGKSGQFFSLPQLARKYANVNRLPLSLRVVLESVVRNCDGKKVLPAHVASLANWKPNAARTDEIPFVVSRVILQDFTGVPLLVDLAAMRSKAVELGADPARIEPLVPVDLVVDHSIMIDDYGRKNSLDLNMKLEFQRNRERYEFMKWGMQAFDTFGVVPPGFGIVHQVNLEFLARGVHKAKQPRAVDGAKVKPVYYPDTLVGTDSHTTMINGIGVVGWGVGGIEAEAAMLGQPVYFLMPDVVGFELTGALCEGVTATDLVLRITEMLRREKVVGSFVEFFGPGTENLALPDRATIANMAPEYGATMGFFPVDDRTIDYFKSTGRTKTEIQAFEAYFKAQGWFGVPGGKSASPEMTDIAYTRVVKLDLRDVTPSVAGPKRPQDRIELGHVSDKFTELFSLPSNANGFHKDAESLSVLYPVPAAGRDDLQSQHPAKKSGKKRSQDDGTPLLLQNGDVLIAAITSCTNTSNPTVLLAAGLLAKKAVKAGLSVAPHIKTSLAPGSRMVTEYLKDTGLLRYLEKLGFSVAGYGCTTCIGNAGDLAPELNAVITENDLVCAAVLSGNRNFEARIHPNLKANFLASPPLVVAYAIAGNVTKDLMTEPVGKGKGGLDIYLGDIWPTSDEIFKLLRYAMNGKAFRANYAKVKKEPGKLWGKIEGVSGRTYTWPQSTYIARPPFFDDFASRKDVNAAEVSGATSAATRRAETKVRSKKSVENMPSRAVLGARIMALFGDSITTDHISPAGNIKESSPAGQWLLAHGVRKEDFNSYGARRGNHEVMVRGTFANVRIKNLMLPALADGGREEGGWTIYHGVEPGAPAGAKLSIFEAAAHYRAAGTPTVVFAGEEYGTGSSRDWAAKGTQLLGIQAVVAQSFERIHRSNLVGMGVLPLQFKRCDSWQSLGLSGSETIDILPDPTLAPQSEAQMVVTRADGTQTRHKLLLRIDTAIEVDYYTAGGILPFVLRQLLAA
jgi:aconitate hydratase